MNKHAFRICEQQKGGDQSNHPCSLISVFAITSSFHLSHVERKLVCGVFDQVGHKSGCGATETSRKHLRTKVTPDFHLTYSKNGGNLGSESK